MIGVVALIFIVLFVVKLAGGSVPFKVTQKTTINNHTFKVKVVNSDMEKQIGLSQTKNLPPDYAMLFPFNQEGYYSFWMKDMKFPIDIIYINNKRIVKVFQNVAAPNQNESLKIYVSPTPADTVLEIKAGLSEKYKLKEGDKVLIDKI